ncbi:MAG: DUF4145 domain-containing protein [Pseudomonadota bacterium]
MAIHQAVVTCPACKLLSMVHVRSDSKVVTLQTPEPQIAEAPEHVPERVLKFFLSAKQAVLDGNEVVASPVLDKAFEVFLQDVEKDKPELKGNGGYAQRLKEMFKTDAVHTSLAEWVEELRIFRNESTHGATDPSLEDIAAALEFMEVVLTYHYTLPIKMKVARESRSE